MKARYADKDAMVADWNKITPENLGTVQIMTDGTVTGNYEDLILESETSTLQPDGSVIVSVMLPHDDWIYGYILGFGTGIEILEPFSVKQNMEKYLNKLQKHFKT